MTIQKQNGDRFNLTWLNCRGGRFGGRLDEEISKLGVQAYGRAHMAAKGDFYVFRAENLRNPAANILKQEFLSKGAEAAVHPNVILGTIPSSVVVMMATRRQYRLICEGLRRQQFGLSVLADELETAIKNINIESWELPLPQQKGNPEKRVMQLSTATKIMGILNITPDSFSDGGSYHSLAEAVARAEEMRAQGAYIIDVGGESTRPGHQQISEEEEIARVVPVIRALKEGGDIPVSIDTYKPNVARAALQAGADIINDIWGLQYDGDPKHEMAALAAEFGCPVIVMHNQHEPVYGARAVEWGEDSGIQADLMSDVALFFRRSREIAREQGMRDEQLIFDIGFGFGKNPEQNMEILARTAALRVLGRPLLVATSRKSTLGLLTGKPVDERVIATAATTAAAAMCGAALVRVHDVAETSDVLAVCRPLYELN